MKRNFKFYLIFSVFYILGASVSAALSYAVGFDTVRPAFFGIDGASGFSDYAVFNAGYLALVSADFLTAFTIYACPVSALVGIYSGAGVGIAAMYYCSSGLNVFTHAAMLIFLIAYLCIFTYLGTEASLYRDTLRAAAPSPAELIRLPETQRILTSYLNICAITVGVGTAMFFFFKYFPI